ncbi:hypothetical protein ACJ3XI_02725 [Litorimonas sp. RW-G-Af-16]
MTYRCVMAAMIVMIFAVQSFALSHTAQFGDSPHEHNGVACDIAVVVSEQCVVTPEITTFPAPAHDLDITDHAPYQDVAFISPQTRAPPPRAPPYL